MTRDAAGGDTPTYVYFGFLTVALTAASPVGALADFPTVFMLKNQLHAGPDQVSMFRVLTAIPAYLAFVFGFTRDRWNPLGLRDRGYFLIFGAAGAAVFLWLALTPLSYAGLFAGMILAMCAYMLAFAAYRGLMALIGQERAMTGRLSTLRAVVSALAAMAAAFGAGWMTDHLRPAQSFLVLAGATATVALVGLWRPAGILRGAYEAPQARRSGFLADLKRLARHRPIYPAVMVMFLFEFAPGWNTPLQYYLTDHLHAPASTYAQAHAMFAAAFVPVYFLYGWLCQRVSLGKLLFWGTIITIPQYVPFAFVRSGETAVWLAAPIGALGGIFAAAMFDLAFRSCPPGLQGTLMMLAQAALLISSRGSDVLGAWIYAADPKHGFLYCVIAITVVYAAILPVLLLIPKSVLATRDGEALAA